MFLVFLLFLCKYSVLSSGQTSYPIASELALPCLNILNQTNVVTNCYNQAMAKWPVQPNGQEDHRREERDICCVEYDQIDCKISAIKSGKCTDESAQAALDYENQLINYWSTTHCLTVPYKSGMCKVNTPASQPTVHSIECLRKCFNETSACLGKIKNEWNITQDQLFGSGQDVPDKSYCCANWEVADCFMDAFMKNCNINDVAIEQKLQVDSATSLNKGKCARFVYHSKNCPHAGSDANELHKMLYVLIFIIVTLYSVN